MLKDVYYIAIIAIVIPVLDLGTFRLFGSSPSDNALEDLKRTCFSKIFCPNFQRQIVRNLHELTDNQQTIGKK